MKWARNTWIRRRPYSSPHSLSGQCYPHTSHRWCPHTTPAWEHPSKQAQAWFVPHMPKHSMVAFTLIKYTGLWAFSVKMSLEKVSNFNMFFPSSPKLCHCLPLPSSPKPWPLSIAIAAPAEFKGASLLWINVALISPPSRGCDKDGVKDRTGSVRGHKISHTPLGWKCGPLGRVSSHFMVPAAGNPPIPFSCRTLIEDKLLPAGKIKQGPLCLLVSGYSGASQMSPPELHTQSWYDGIGQVSEGTMSGGHCAQKDSSANQVSASASVKYKAIPRRRHLKVRGWQTNSELLFIYFFFNPMKLRVLKTIIRQKNHQYKIVAPKITTRCR